MARPELGSKRLCPNCGTKYYDLGRDPVICPKCGTPFDAVAARVRPASVADEGDEAEDEVGPEFVPLEEADAEVEGDDVPDDIADPEVAKDIEGDDDFLEEPEDEGDVADIVPGVGDEEER